MTPAKAARASAAAPAAPAEVSATGAATALPVVSAAAARTAFRGMGSITRLFQLWSTRAFSVKSAVQYPPRVFLIRIFSSASCYLFIFSRLRRFSERAFSITVSPRATGPVWTARSIRVVLELLQRTGHPGAICATRQVVRTECKRCRECYYTW